MDTEIVGMVSPPIEKSNNQGAICEKTRGGDNFEKHFIQEK